MFCENRVSKSESSDLSLAWLIDFFYRESLTTVVFRLPHRPQDRLVPIGGVSDIGNRGRRNGETEGVDGHVGLLVGCPAGYGLRESHCREF